PKPYEETLDKWWAFGNKKTTRKIINEISNINDVDVINSKLNDLRETGIDKEFIDAFKQFRGEDYKEYKGSKKIFKETSKVDSKIKRSSSSKLEQKKSNYISKQVFDAFIDDHLIAHYKDIRGIKKAMFKFEQLSKKLEGMEGVEYERSFAVRDN